MIAYRHSAPEDEFRIYAKVRVNPDGTFPEVAVMLTPSANERGLWRALPEDVATNHEQDVVGVPERTRTSDL